MGRPSIYSEELANEICSKVSDGASLFRVCDETEGLPGHSTVFRWLEESATFRDKYARAKQIALERMAEEINSIADNTEEDANSRRVRVDSRKWLLSKLLPKVYGDATMLKHADADGNSMKIEVTRVKRPELTPPLKLLEAAKDSD